MSGEGQSLVTVAIVLVGTVVALLPMLLRIPAPTEVRPERVQVALTASLHLLPFVVMGIAFGRERRRARANTLALFILLAFLTRWMNQIHFVLVDSSSGLFPYPNEVWQRKLHDDIMRLSPEALPHSYRFLANSIVRLLELVTADYGHARWVYREVVVFLLLFASYRYARLYVDHQTALVSLILCSVVYPFTLLRYAGQPIDPLSHLSFVLVFIFLEKRQFWYLVLAVLVGSLAKETVLGMVGFYVLFRRSDRHYLARSALLVALAVGCYLGVRYYVLSAVPQYLQISGVGFAHVITNLNSKYWYGLTFYTIGLFVPFFALGFRSTPRSLNQTVVYTFVMITVASLFFSWLAETRNLMPVVVPLAILTARYLMAPAVVSPEATDTDAGGTGLGA